ncbi:MAG TPA: hypothetical protein VK363_17210 [Pyrinomonadaceae bacterium]|nr:hypothetical protein [Pyrinomonadaceae bacterium]
MTLKTTRLRLTGPRALLVVIALVTLCVSDNIGPRLLPLPVSPEFSTATTQGNQDVASPLAASGESNCFRVPIIAQIHKRGSLQFEPPPATHAPGHAPAQPVTAQTASQHPRASLLITSAPVSQPSGRAPPSHV